MSMKRSAAAALAAALCLLTAACGSSSDAANGTNGKAAGQTTGYPVTLENCGRKLTFEKAPERVVVMNGASVAEVSTLLALGLEDRIVANQQGYGRSEVPGRADAIKKLPTGGVTLNGAGDIPREAMLGLRPDLALSVTSYGFEQKNGFATREQLQQVGANSYISPQGCDDDPSKMTVADSYQLLRDMGKIFHVGDRAEKLIAESEKKITAVTGKAGTDKPPKVMVLFASPTGKTDFSLVFAKGIVNDILAGAGGVNAFEDTAETLFANVSKEKAATTDVDALVVIDASGTDAAAYAKKLLKEFPQWPAARTNTYVTLSDSMYLGPSNDLAVKKIAEVLHADAS
ncbi:ABC transporter substrate-binding protein [Streptomyces sp. ME03-5684b]|uniref:ABC transporter substrate-binding protein n=1 Tax=Streptomyces sp. ME03-5684b TaxID=3028681 RepID=UPI0029ABD737|nr:ABC transporter substrate-binding protein [Streptomyces sp. ME03-5684b]MDX3319684.1 ABC transporter substrate-binding protein [Streptomyces sp. ME03-5684b]